MEALNFKLLDAVRTLPECCKIHKQTHLLQLDGKPPFCPDCTKQNINSINANVATAGVWQEYRRSFHDALTTRSIVDDADIWQASFANYKTEPGSEAADNLLKARRLAGKYLDRSYKADTILVGNPGVGKTHLAMSMLKGVNENIKPDAMCLFISVNEAVRRVKSSFNDRQCKYTEAYLTRLAGASNLLLLDDLGSEASFTRKTSEASDWVQQLLFGILNKRKGRTIITTNLTSKELTDIYNPKLLSRIYKGVAKHEGIIKFTEATADKRKDLF